MAWCSVYMELHRAVLYLAAQSCLTLCDPMDCSPPGSLSMGILQERILEWIAMPSSRGSSQPRDRTLVSHIAGRFFTVWATTLNTGVGSLYLLQGIFPTRNWTEALCIAGGFFTSWATREAHVELTDPK